MLPTKINSGNGPVLLFLHAFPLNNRIWDAQIAELASKCMILAPNLPGFGESPILHPYTIEICADSISDIIKDMENVIICGISMGGYIAFEMWRKYPKKIKALILADTRAEADSPEARENRQRQIALIKAGNQKEVIRALTEKLVSDETKQKHPDVFGKIVHISSSAPPEALICTLEALAGRRDSIEMLTTINVPTLIIVGENDSITPPAVASSMNQNIKGSELHILPGAGHLPPLEVPDLFNSIVDNFLDKIF